MAIKIEASARRNRWVIILYHQRPRRSKYKLISGAIIENTIIFIIVLVGLLALFKDFYKNKILLVFEMKTKKKKHEIKFNPSKIIKKHYMLYAIALLVLSLAYACVSLHVYRYIVIATSPPSTLFEDHYVDQKLPNLHFRPQNVI